MVSAGYDYYSFIFLATLHHNQQLTDTITPAAINIIPVLGEHLSGDNPSSWELLVEPDTPFDLLSPSTPTAIRIAPTNVPTIAPTKAEVVSVGVVVPE